MDQAGIVSYYRKDVAFGHVEYAPNLRAHRYDSTIYRLDAVIVTGRDARPDDRGVTN